MTGLGPPSEVDWQRYLADFHGARPSITERVLSRVAGSPYAWLVEPLRGAAGTIVDLACGSAPTRDHLAEHRWVGVDISAEELAAAVAAGRGPVLRARADALPLGDEVADAVCAAMALQVLTPLPDVLAEVERVLRPGGVLVALAPSRPGMSLRGWLGWARVLVSLGLTNQPWPNPQACDGLAELLDRRGFEIAAAERRSFAFPLETASDADLLIDSLYLPNTDANRVAAAKRSLRARTRPGHDLPLPLRRIIAHRTGSPT